MKKLIYTFTLTTAMLASSAAIWATPDHGNGGGDKDCETACEAKKEQCEKLKPDTAAFNACIAKVQQDCNNTCENRDNNERHRDRNRRDR